MCGMLANLPRPQDDPKEVIAKLQVLTQRLLD